MFEVTMSPYGRVPFTKKDIEDINPTNEVEELIFPAINPFLSGIERRIYMITLAIWVLYSSVITRDCRDHLFSKLFLGYCTYQKRIIDKVRSIKAVITLQAHVRGHLTRVVSLQKAMKENSSLATHLAYADTQPYISYKLLSLLPRAPFGKTPVFMPTGSMQVLKLSGNSERRLQHMESMRDFCESSDWKHLVIPKAFIRQKILIEERLPIEHRLEGQIAFYLIHWKELTEAVKEFIALSFSCGIGDLTNNSFPYHFLLPSNASCPRYDNISFFIDTENEKEGVSRYKIGLIDLEHIHPRDSILIRDDILEILVILFPNHLELIVEMARRYKDIQDCEVEKLLQLQEDMLIYFQKVAGDHIAFLQDQKITWVNVDQPFILTEEQKYQTKARIEILWEEHFEEQSHLKEAFLEKILPLIFKELAHEINDQLQKNIKNIGGKESISSYGKVIVCRRIWEYPNSWEETFMKRSVFAELDREMFQLTWRMLIYILEALAAEGALARYDSLVDSKHFSLSF